MKHQFERDGFIVLENVFDPEETVRMKAEIQRILSAGPEDTAPVRADALAGFHKHGVFLGLAHQSELFREAARHDATVAALRDILGDDVVFLNDKVVYKSGVTTFGSPWHQDWPYWKGSHKISVWIALDAATTGNGCLKVIPGSHRHGVLEHGGAADDGLGFNNRMSGDVIDESAAIPVELEAGGAVIFHDLLLHASYPNTSGQDRWAVISTYKDGRQPDPPYDWATAPFSVATPDL
jgi:ectoine hydroxylase-related dioxygenase (phytanoyl-CoA dioxygenase family)